MKRTKKVIMDELAEAIMEREYIENVLIGKLQDELRQFKLTKQEKEDYEIYE
jgi:hypothetical protein